MINKAAVIALALFSYWVPAVAGAGTRTIAVQNRDSAALTAAGAQVYECVENAGKFICKFRELSAKPAIEPIFADRFRDHPIDGGNGDTVG